MRPVCFASILVWALIAGASQAQPRAEVESLPDLDLYVTSIDAPRGNVRFLALGALSGGARVGQGGESWWVEGGAETLFGWTSGQTTRVQQHSRVSFGADIQPGLERVPLAGTVGGTHALILRHGAGGFDPRPLHERGERRESMIWSNEHLPDHFEAGALGADLELDARVAHGRVGEGFARFDAGAGRFATFDVTAGWWLRRAYDDEQAFVMPLRLRYGATLAELGPGEGVDLAGRRIGLSTGFGFKHYFHYHFHGWLEALGLGWDRFAPAEGAAVDRLELRALHIDDVLFRDRAWGMGPEWLWVLRAWVGAHWLTAEQGARDHGMPVFDLAFGARFPVEEADVELTIGGGRQGAPTLQTGRFAERYRLETRAALEMHGFGGETTVASGWQRDLERDGDLAQQIVVASSLWMDIAQPLSLGVYHRAQRGTPVDGDALALDDRWRHDVGLFLRLRGGHRGGERFEEGPAGFSVW